MKLIPVGFDDSNLRPAMMKHELRVLILTAFCGVLISARCQFTQVGIGFNYSSAKFQDEPESQFGTGSNGYNLKNLGIDIRILLRPTQRVGVGLNISIPAVDFSSETYGYTLQSATHLEPVDLSHQISLEFGASLFARFFFDTKVNSFIQASYTYRSMEEKFRFIRPYYPGSVDYLEAEAVDIDYSGEVGVWMPGVAVGAMPKVGDHFQLDLSLGVDFLSAQSGGFSYTILFDEKIWLNGPDRYVYRQYSSYLDEASTILNIRAGVNYVF